MSHEPVTSQNALFQLKAAGQTYWLDNLTRAMIRSGELKRRITEEGLRGITSNPTTFYTALKAGADYDEEIRRLAQNGIRGHVSMETLMVQDVQDACDIFLPLYKSSGRLDGYVSVEVSPHYAHNTNLTMEHARRLHAQVQRPNVMIKVPGTSACVPAIEALLHEGLNINITLLFSIQNYQAVMEAYLNALERRVKTDWPIDGIASVASFFVSRVDTLIDQLLAHRIDQNSSDPDTMPTQLLGKVAVANAQVAYKYFKQVFSGERWDKLTQRGARVQRLLWASTGRKNPAYSDVAYVELLVGRDTVNTMPESTIKAFADHGRVVPNAIEEDADCALELLRDLENVGIDYRCAMVQLENEGIQKFIESYDACVEVINWKCHELEKAL